MRVGPGLNANGKTSAPSAKSMLDTVTAVQGNMISVICCACLRLMDEADVHLVAETRAPGIATTPDQPLTAL
jgi:hypothetical protein